MVQASTPRNVLDWTTIDGFIREAERGIEDWYNELDSRPLTLPEFTSRLDGLEQVPEDLAELRRIMVHVGRNVSPTQAIARTRGVDKDAQTQQLWIRYLRRPERENPDVYYLARIIVAEALSEPLKSRRAVGWTIIHRLEIGDTASFCGGSIRQVIECPSQFKGVGNKQWKAFSAAGMSSTPDFVTTISRNLDGMKECLRIAYGIIARTEPDELPRVTFFNKPEPRQWAHDRYLEGKMDLLWVSPTGKHGYYDRPPQWWLREKGIVWPRP